MQERGVQEQEKGQEVELKQGGRYDYRFARAYLNLLRDFERGQPETFAALCRLACGDEPPPAVDLRSAEQAGLVADGRLRDIVRDVLRSALTKTPEGFVLGDPFRPKTEEERELLRRAERSADDFLLRLTDGLSPPDQSEPPPRPR